MEALPVESISTIGKAIIEDIVVARDIDEAKASCILPDAVTKLTADPKRFLKYLIVSQLKNHENRDADEKSFLAVIPVDGKLKVAFVQIDNKGIRDRFTNCTGFYVAVVNEHDYTVLAVVDLLSDTEEEKKKFGTIYLWSELRVFCEVLVSGGMPSCENITKFIDVPSLVSLYFKIGYLKMYALNSVKNNIQFFLKNEY